MNPVILIAGIFLFVSGIVLGRQSESPSSEITTITSSPTPTSSETPALTNTPEPTIVNTQKPTPIPTKPSATSKPKSSTNLSDFKYPGSSINSDSAGKLVLSSNDSPSSITTWYENRIKELGYSSRASAKTNTNGNVTNKLGGGKDNSSVSIEIVKKANEGSTTITVTTGTDSGSDVQIKIENNEPYL